MSFEANFDDFPAAAPQEQAAAQGQGRKKPPSPPSMNSPSPTPSNQSRMSDASRGSRGGGRGRGAPPPGRGRGGRGPPPGGARGGGRGRGPPPGARGGGGGGRGGGPPRRSPPPPGSRPQRPRSRSVDGAGSGHRPLSPNSASSSSPPPDGAGGPPGGQRRRQRPRQSRSVSRERDGPGPPPPANTQRVRGGQGGESGHSRQSGASAGPGRIPGGRGRGGPSRGGGSGGRGGRGPPPGRGRGRGGGRGGPRGGPPPGRGGRGRGGGGGGRSSPPNAPRGQQGPGGPSFGPGRGGGGGGAGGGGGGGDIILNPPPTAARGGGPGFDQEASFGTLETGGDGSYRPLMRGRRGTGDWGRQIDEMDFEDEPGAGGGGGGEGRGRRSRGNGGRGTMWGGEGEGLVEPSRLYILCEIALPKPEDEAHRSSSARGDPHRLGQSSHHARGAAAGVGEAGAPYVSRSEARRRRDLLLETWDCVREFLRTQTAPDRRTAATYLGMFGMTPLHVVCKLPDPPPDVVEGLIECAPETLSWADSNGWLPLHHACANGASGTVLGLLVENHPEGRVAQDRRMRTPLHFAFFRSDVRSEHEGRGLNDGLGGDQGVGGNVGGGEGTVKRGTNLEDAIDGVEEEEEEHDDEGTITGGDPNRPRRRTVGNSMPDIVALLSDGGAATLRDENGMLPLHYACAYGTSTGVLCVLLDRHPASLAARENKGRTPLHLAMVNAHRGASPGVLRYLLGRSRSTHVVNMIDAEGHLPLHLLANVSQRLRPEQKDAQRNATDCLRLYLSARPKPTADFLTAIQALPEWLRDDAVVNPHVQGVLNDKIARRFPTSILMMDGYVLLIIIVCFELASVYHIDYRFTGVYDPSKIDAITGCVVLVLMGGGYFLLREAVQVVSMIHLGTFRSWLFDLTNWLDVILIALVSYFGAAMLNPTIGSNDVFRNGCAITKGVLWISFINFVKSTLIDFAVFVGGVYYVLRRLLAFMVSLIVILLAFAQMFYIVYSRDVLCETDEETGEYVNHDSYCFEDFPHCTFEISLLKVYSMMMGEIGDECRYSSSPVAQALYVTYAFVVVIILSNVLIAIVTDSYGVIKNERAAMVFWSNRLDFVTEMDAILSVRRAFFGGDDRDTLGSKNEHTLDRTNGRETATRGPQDDMNNPGGGDGVSIGMSTMHDRRYDGYQRDNRTGVMYNGWAALMSLFETDLSKDMDISPGTMEFWLYLGVRFLALVVVVPAWVFLGIATAGWLWPPQVREWLFVQRKTAQTRADMAEEARREIQKLRRGLRALKLELRGEKRSDRRELAAMRDEVEGVQREVTADLGQVKEIMGTLLELGREQAAR